MWVLALSGVVLLAGTASVLAGLAIISRHEAGTAADLAALAAASRALSGPEIACAQAELIAAANGAVLEACTLAADGVVDVTVAVSVEFGSLGLGVARAQARAGPAEAEPAEGGPVDAEPAEAESAEFGRGGVRQGEVRAGRGQAGRVSPQSAKSGSALSRTVRIDLSPPRPGHRGPHPGS